MQCRLTMEQPVIAKGINALWYDTYRNPSMFVLTLNRINCVVSVGNVLVD